MTRDKQLAGIKLKAVLQKQRFGQALNVKEFAVLAGISYSIARDWFRARGFPVFNGKVFWQDFVMWRQRQTGIEVSAANHTQTVSVPPGQPALEFPEKARRLLAQA